MSKEYNIGIYIRLSMADEDTGYGSKAESDSIGNQRMLINRFLDDHPELSGCQRSEFADDGYTGTNFPPSSVHADDGEGQARRNQSDLRQGLFPLFS